MSRHADKQQAKQSAKLRAKLFRNMCRVTAMRRDQAFQALANAESAIRDYRNAKSADWKAFFAGSANASIMAARIRRIAGVEYPRIPGAPTR
jgi:stress response protein SCP2